MSVVESGGGAGASRSGPSGMVLGLIDKARARLSDTSDSGVAQRMAGAAFLIRVLSAAIAYLSQVLMARWMGAFEFGIYIYVWVWVLILGQLSNFGFASSAQRFIPEYEAAGDKDGLRGFLFGSRLAGLGFGTVIAAVGVALLWAFGHHVSPLILTPLFLALVCVPVYVLTDIQDGIARANNWTDVALGPPYLIRPILILGTMVGAHALGAPATAQVAMTCAVFATWVTALAQFVALNARLKGRVEPGPRRSEFPLWAKVSLPIFLAEASYIVLTFVDVVMLKHLRSPEEVAIYWAAVKTLALVAFIYFAVSAAAAHRFTQYHVAGDKERLSAFLSETIRWTFFPSLAATLVILALGIPFLSLFGPEFVKGYPAMFVVSIGLLARATMGPAERLLSMTGHQGASAWIYAAALATAVGLGLALIPPFGIMGAAAAMAAALVVESILLFVMTKRRLGLTVSFRHKA